MNGSQQMLGGYKLVLEQKHHPINIIAQYVGADTDDILKDLETD